MYRVTWVFPTTRTDGTELTAADISHVRIRLQGPSGLWQQIGDHLAGPVSIGELGPGTWAAEGVLVDTDGRESAPAIATLTIDNPVGTIAPPEALLDFKIELVPDAAEMPAYRGVIDPSSVLGFNVFGAYTVSEALTGTHGATTLIGAGTPDSPHVIDLSNAIFNGRLAIEGEYIIVQGPTVNASDGSGGWISLSGAINSVVRDATVKGPQIDSGNSSAISMGTRTVWIGGEVSNFGDISEGAREQDYHGFKVMRDDVWILDAHVHHVSGDSVQVGDSSRGSASRVYIAGGLFHDNRENGVDVKDSFDVVVSRNTMHTFRPSISSPGEAMIFHDDAIGGKALDNIIYDTTIGIVSSGLRDHVIDGNSIDAIETDIELRNTDNITVTNNFNPSGILKIDNQGNVTGTVQDGN